MSVTIYTRRPICYVYYYQLSVCTLIANRNVLLPESQKMPLIYKVIWILQNITYVTAPMVSFFYWNFKSDGKTSFMFAMKYESNCANVAVASLHGTPY